MSGVLNAPIIKMIAVNGWTLDITEDEPRIRDVDLAERAGLKQPRDIRRVIERYREELEEFGRLDMRVHCARISKPRGGYEERRVTEFWLTEHQATTVLLQLRTPQARRVRVGVVKVFIAYRRGQLVAPQPAPQPVPVPVLPNSPALGDLYRDDIERRCKVTAKCTDASVHLVHGCLRMLFNAPGVYRIKAVHHAEVLRVLDMLALGEMELPSKKRRPRLKLVADPRQQVIPFPDVRASKPAPETP